VVGAHVAMLCATRPQAGYELIINGLQRPNAALPQD
jgi:hypothetical protein